MGTLSELAAMETPKGEIVVLVAPGAPVAWSDGDVDAALSQRAHLSVKDAAKEVAELSGRSKRDLYTRAQEMRDGQDGG